MTIFSRSPLTVSISVLARRIIPPLLVVKALQFLMTHHFDVADIMPYLQVLHEPMDRANYLSERQAVAILELRLHRLTAMEQKEIKDELEAVINDIRDYIEILGSKERVDNLMIQEWHDIKLNYPTPRRTKN